MSINGADNANTLGAGAGKIPDTASKTPQQLSISTKVTTFQEVQRALEEVKGILEQLNAKQIPSSLSDESETEGAPGSIRIIKTDAGNNLFEIKTEMGWQKPMVGQTQVTFKSIESNVKESTPKSIDELEAADTITGDKVAEKTIFDEKANKFILPRPDYDSGWVDVDDHRTQGTHDLGVTPILAQVQWSDDDGVNVHVNWDTTASNGYDIWATTTTWQVTSSTYYGWYNESTVGGATGWTRIDAQGKFRVLLWK